MSPKKLSQRDEMMCVICASILLSDDYCRCYAKWIEAKRKNKKYLEQKWFYEIASRWGILNPIDPETDPRTIPIYLLEIYFDRGEILLNKDVHLQLGGKKKVSSKVDIAIDLNQNKTKILKKVGSLVSKLQLLRKEQANDKKLPDGKKGLLTYSLKDFDVYKKYRQYGKSVKEIPFHKIARKKLGQDEISTEVDLKSKNLEESYKRADWLRRGGWELLVKRL